MRTFVYFGGSSCLYLLACAFPAFDGQQGFEFLVGLPEALFIPFWWANPLFFAGCTTLVFGKARLASWLGITASGIAASFFGVVIYFGDLRNIEIGSVFWMISMLGLTAAGRIGRTHCQLPGRRT
jgi:hypothetical protein